MQDGKRPGAQAPAAFLLRICRSGSSAGCICSTAPALLCSGTATLMTSHASPPAHAPEPVFEARGLKKNYDDGQVQALRGVDFRIGAGEFVAIVGPSGCGKTTLLQLLGALDHPSEGSLAYRG